MNARVCIYIVGHKNILPLFFTITFIIHNGEQKIPNGLQRLQCKYFFNLSLNDRVEILEHSNFAK